MKSSTALHVSLHSSRWGSILVCVACLTTSVLVAWLPGPAAIRGALVIGIAAYAIGALRHWAMRSSPRAVVDIDLDVDRAVCLTERSGLRIEGLVLPDSYVGAWVTTLVVRRDGRRRVRTVAILPDMLAIEDFRRLRLLLRLGREAAMAAES